MLQYFHQTDCTTRDQGNAEEPTLQEEKEKGIQLTIHLLLMPRLRRGAVLSLCYHTIVHHIIALCFILWSLDERLGVHSKRLKFKRSTHYFACYCQMATLVV